MQIGSCLADSRLFDREQQALIEITH